jgi:hypothetical protein
LANRRLASRRDLALKKFIKRIVLISLLPFVHIEVKGAIKESHDIVPNTFDHQSAKTTGCTTRVCNSFALSLIFVFSTSIVRAGHCDGTAGLSGL